MEYFITESALDKLQLLDSMSYNHCVRSSEIAREIESKFDLGSNLLSKAALVHDVGKIYVSSKILGKPDQLDFLERKIIDLHPYIGYQILRQCGVNEKICTITLYHHGVKPPMLSDIKIKMDDEIKHYALMLHTIDAFEALTTDRSYRRGYTQAKAVEIMDKESMHDKNVLDFLHTYALYADK